MTYAEQLSADQARIESSIAEYVDSLWPFGNLVESMSYSLLSGGKRIRPILTLASCRFCGGEVTKALSFACGLEMIHTYSLIHDDLPCMDDDDFRRGRPTNHRVYGQATAVLAGDALLTSAFEVLAKAPGLHTDQLVLAVRCLSEAAGPSGMVAGQILDMVATDRDSTFEQIQTIESLKTGKLIEAAVQLGCIAANVEGERMQALTIYAQKLGLAFQIQDDILDYDGDEAELGKPIGSDAANGKVTFVTLKGIVGCREMVRRLTEEAVEEIKQYEESGFLCWLAEMLAERKK
ncbi:MAG: geranylgeranyl pyrophosphate synthase [Evtepia sp.]|jgi:geranylgeranyl diphosphate synthase type II|nr:geranylgeranyl pyrophosphate synthase [Evtepia sp.]